MFRWDENTIRFRIDAAEYGGFDAKLAAHILPEPERNAHICDAGCGLGYLSLALAPLCRRVTAVDTSASALGVLRKNARKAGLSNIEIAEGDLFSMRPQTKYDTMVFCMFGGAYETLRAVEAQCAGKAFLIKKNWATHRFTLKEKPLERHTFLQTCAALDALGIPYQTETFPLEMGQPFRSLEEAALFYRIYAREDMPSAGTDESGKSDEKERIAENLVETGRTDFPYYLPSGRPLGIISLNAGDIPASIKTIHTEEST